MLTTIKEYACYAVKMYKNKPKNISKQGEERGVPGAPVLDPPLYTSWNTELVDWLIDWINFYAVSAIF